MKQRFANIVFNLPVDSMFTYIVPTELNDLVQIGSRVVVSFGKRKLTGIVIDFTDESMQKNLKPILDSPDIEPVISQELIDFCKWLSEYYICPLGEVIFTALPKSVVKNTLSKFEKLVRFELREEFEGFTNQQIENFCNESKIKSVKQKELLKYLIKNRVEEITLNTLVKESGISAGVINSLAGKQIINIESKQVQRRVEEIFTEEEKEITLNSEQNNVLEKIYNGLSSREFKPFLLFGVTGSGKTQIYIEAIKKILSKNQTAIVLVPEISLTPQLIHRFRKHFGDLTGVVHSRLSDGQRFDVYNRIISGEVKLVVGARSALFAPLKNIGVIIVDEEHDHSYKQTEKMPLYNARDSAIVRAKMNKAVVILGSATPSLEGFYNVHAGKYELLELPHRALKNLPPKVEIVNMLEEMKSKSKFIKSETPEQRFLSSKLISEIKISLSKKQSIILLQNRRGYSAYQECQECGNVKMCPNCDITLIYHKIKNHLKCHYCGHIENIPELCERCSSPNLLLKGTGTEKVEEEIMRLFPKAKMMRMDADTVTRKDAHAKILKSFHDREFDILIGTQMISKGLDFPNVGLVGVISADVGLLNPDFRSHERTFQLMMQVAGRSGRSNDFGKVIIQTMHADHFIFPLLVNHDYISFFEKEIGYRNNFGYPPFSRMTLLEIESPDAAKSNSVASKIYLFLTNKLLSTGIASSQAPRNDSNNGIELMKPSPALIFKIKNKYRYHVIIKSLKSVEGSMNKTEWLLKELKRKLETMKLGSSTRVRIDVDPLSFY